ncbi:4-(cytidine 5'-diphospho)-2-C-methyl-D-erythritol kinase [Candidatus Peregrinibacteria bacterium]|nr:4-(cytidine 5'-diphospho)-2-C-methyl-D-erythritol kinase [Candidatus Peregrinibacteria bacterium]
MKFYSYPKLNLCIDIIEKSPSGYHIIRTVLYELKTLKDEPKTVKDELIFFKNKQKQKLSIEYGKKIRDSEQLINSSNNLILSAIKLVKNRFNIDENLHVHLNKNIPISSGLGGGSSNAACTLKALNKIWDLGLSTDELAKLGAELGMDVPFFIYGGTALAENFGEKITPLPEIKGIEFKLLEPIKNPLFVDEKTKMMYQALDLNKCNKNAHKTNALIKAIKNSDLKGVINNIHNDFETLVDVEEGTHLSGSGPSIFKAQIALK